MSAYGALLMAETAAREEQRAKQRRAELELAASAARERLTPLEDRLARLLAGIPLEVQREGLSLPALRASLRGRWRGNCHPGELGAALRKLGFQRKRQWGSEASFRAVWVRGSSCGGQ